MRTRPEPSARWWKQRERHALAGYRRDLIHDLGVLAEQATEICRVEPPGLGLLGLRFPGRLLVMAGVGPHTWREVTELVSGRPVQLVDAGRYGRLWWITLSDGAHDLLIACSHLRLIYAGDGRRSDPVESGPCVDASREAT
jgi:hypothetical protein